MSTPPFITPDFRDPLWLVAVFVCIGWMVSLCLHEFGHAIVAYWGGDTSVKDKGYLTLNPLKYTDPGLSLILPLFILLIGGIALPGGAVYINQGRLRNRWWKSAVSAAGPFSNIVVVLLLALPFQLGWTTPALVNNSPIAALLSASLAFVVLLNIYVILINLLPIPSLDGYGILEPWLPPTLQQQFQEVGKFGIWILIGLLWFVQPFNQFLWNITHTASELLGVPLELAMAGSAVFSRYSLFLVVGLILIFLLFRDKTDDLRRKGNQLLGAGRYEAAIATYDQMLQKQPDHAEALYLKGYALFALGRYEEAIATYDTALKLKPDYAEVWSDRGAALQNLQHYEDALASYDKATQLQPELAWAWQGRGSVLSALQRDEDALDSFERAIQLKTNNGVAALNGKGIALRKLHRYEEAIAVFDQVLQRDPKYADAWYNKACCAALHGDKAIALQALKKVILLNPERFKPIISTDPDLDSLRAEATFQALVEH